MDINRLKIMSKLIKHLPGISVYWLFILFFCLNQCRNNPTAPEQTPSSLKIEAEKFKIYAGGILQLKAIAQLKDGTTKDVTKEAIWSNSPGLAGKITKSGKFITNAEATGKETVTAQFQGQVASVVIEVTKRAEIFSILPMRTKLLSGESIQFKAIATYPDRVQEIVTDQVQWKVNKPEMGSIDSKGLFQSNAGATGFVMIEGSFQDVIENSILEIVASPSETIESEFQMVKIPGGTFIMGDDTSRYADEKPAHEVFVDPFLISKFEITNNQYVDFLNQALGNGAIIVESNLIIGTKGRFPFTAYLLIQAGQNFPSEFIEFIDGTFKVKDGFEDYPVIRVSWYGAVAFCDFYGLRLPTEAEWEKASRGGQQLEYGTQDGTLSHDLANYRGTEGRDIFPDLAPVGQFPPNPFGLFDMAGNVAEFVHDIYASDFYMQSPSNNPSGPGPREPLLNDVSDDDRVVWRGGSWFTGARFCRSARRGHIRRGPDLVEQIDVGFRVAKSISTN